LSSNARKLSTHTTHGKTCCGIKIWISTEEIIKRESRLEFQTNQREKQCVLVSNQTNNMSTSANVDLASAALDWEALSASNATGWEIANVDWASVMFYCQQVPMKTRQVPIWTEQHCQQTMQTTGQVLM
jgi:hypothetical protein